MKSKRVVVTRAAAQARELVRALEDRGAIPVLYPCIAIEAPEDTRDLDYGLKLTVRGEHDWVVLTSANTVSAVAASVTTNNPNASHLRAAGAGHGFLRGLIPSGSGP